MRKHISQREARRTAKALAALRDQVERNARAWSDEWVNGVPLCDQPVTDVAASVVRTARMLGCAVVAVPRSDGSSVIRLYAVKP